MDANTYTLVNVTVGTEDGKSAVRLLEYEIASLRAAGGKLMKVWHGTGPIGDAVRRAVKRLKREGRVDIILAGEDISEENAVARYLLDRYPGLSEWDDEWNDASTDYLILTV